MDPQEKANPKKPGRKPGEGKFSRCDLPTEEEIMHESKCRCKGTAARSAVRIERAFCTDISECGRTLRDPSQHGATSHRVGNGVFTCAHALHYGIGVPMRKVPMILRELCGVSITQSAIQQDAMHRNQAGESASMMGFDTDEARVYKSVYVIATRRSASSSHRIRTA